MGKTIYELRTKDGSTFVKCEPTTKESIIQMAKDADLFSQAELESGIEFVAPIPANRLDETQVFDVYPKSYILCFDCDESGGHTSVRMVRKSQFGTPELKQELTEILGEQLGLGDEEDAEVLAEFNEMIENVANGHCGDWMGNNVYYDKLDVI
jgi:hypothetical protein